MKKKGFTLVELLAVIAVLALLVIIALPKIMGMFEEAKRKSFENEVKNLYKAVESQVMSDMFSNPTSEEKIYSSNSESTNHLSLQGRDNIKYCIVIDGKGNIKKIYVSDGSHQYISDDFVSLKNIENIEVLEKAYEDLESIESCTRTPIETSLLDYSVSNGKVTINGFKSNLVSFQVVDMNKCTS